MQLAFLLVWWHIFSEIASMISIAGKVWAMKFTCARKFYKMMHSRCVTFLFCLNIVCSGIVHSFFVPTITVKIVFTFDVVFNPEVCAIWIIISSCCQKWSYARHVVFHRASKRMFKYVSKFGCMFEWFVHYTSVLVYRHISLAYFAYLMQLKCKRILYHRYICIYITKFLLSLVHL